MLRSNYRRLVQALTLFLIQEPHPCITVGTDTDTIMVITRLYGSTTAFVSLKVCYVDTIGDTLVTCLVTAARPVERFLI